MGERLNPVEAVGVAVGMALLAAVMFAVAAVVQNAAVTAVLRVGQTQLVGGEQFRSLARSRTWVGGVSLTAIASMVHAGALVLAPVAVVQPIGVLSVPLAVVLAANAAQQCHYSRGSGETRYSSASMTTMVSISRVRVVARPGSVRSRTRHVRFLSQADVCTGNNDPASYDLSSGTQPPA